MAYKLKDYNIKDYNRFCRKCSWNDPDYGCIVDPYERVYQCPLYMHYHPEEVKQCEEDCKEWLQQKQKKERQVIAMEKCKVCGCTKFKYRAVDNKVGKYCAGCGTRICWMITIKFKRRDN